LCVRVGRPGQSGAPDSQPRHQLPHPDGQPHMPCPAGALEPDATRTDTSVSPRCSVTLPSGTAASLRLGLGDSSSFHAVAGERSVRDQKGLPSSRTSPTYAPPHEAWTGPLRGGPRGRPLAAAVNRVRSFSSWARFSLVTHSVGPHSTHQ
jgi:hypothetical protein